MRTRTLVCTAAACLALAACDSSTGSEPLRGVYAARGVEGRPLPAMLDSSFWTDGTTYSVHRVLAASVEFLGRDSVQYTWAQSTVTFFAPGDSVWGRQCLSMPVPYRREGDRVVLIVEPALAGEPAGRLRLDTLHVSGETLVHELRLPSGRPARVEYARAVQAADCTLDGE